MSRTSGWDKIKHLPADDPRRIHARKYARENLAGKGGRKRTPEEKKIHSRAQSLRRNFGLTAEAYDVMNTAQGGVCAICGNPDYTKAGRPRRLAVDHNHQTGALRKLLCKDCNLGLGYFHDDLLLLRVAVSYLEKCLIS